MQKLLKDDEVSELIGIPKGTLANWRSGGGGPPFVKLSNLVRYRPEDLEKWISERVTEKTDGTYGTGGATEAPRKKQNQPQMAFQGRRPSAKQLSRLRGHVTQSMRREAAEKAARSAQVDIGAPAKPGG